MKKKLNEMTITELRHRRESLQQTISICSSYLASCPNTFLGPLGARAEIRRCKKEIDLINEMLATNN